MADTIFALSSGAPPAGLAVLRISGEHADAALLALAGRLPPYRRAALMRLHDPEDGMLLDEALVLRFAAGASATGDAGVELQCHGGRAVVAAVEKALARLPGLRRAEPGEFTRRAVMNGRMGLNEAEGLADLLEAETEDGRRDALARTGGALAAAVRRWETHVLSLSASVEADLDFADEDEMAGGRRDYGDLLHEIGTLLARPPAERLHDGLRVVIGGPPNSGKSTLLNAIVAAEAAIVSPVAGTTRDVIDVPVRLGGVPLRIVDTAGLRASSDAVESIGIDRARDALEAADLVLWLGPAGEGPAGVPLWEVAAKADLPGTGKPGAIAVSARSGAGIAGLLDRLVAWARTALPPADGLSLNQRLREVALALQQELGSAARARDPLIEAEHLRVSRTLLDRLSGRSGTEEMLDSLFARFCIGK